MKHLVLLLLLLLPCFAFGQKAIEASLPDGRRVLLRPDKTWEYVTPRQSKQPSAKSGEDQLRVEPLESLVALMKKTPEVFTQDESESQEQYFTKLSGYFNKTDLNGIKLIDTFFALPADFNYQFEEGEIHTWVDFLDFDQRFSIVSRSDGIYGSASTVLKLKMSLFEARKVKPFLRLAVNALPVSLERDKVRLLPVKYIIYDDRDKKVLTTISTKNEIN